MASDLISRDTLIKDMYEDGYFPLTVADKATEKIMAQPTVDAVEVVRCKDCIYYKEGDLLAPNKFCYRLKHPTEDRNIGYNFSDDDYCSYGKKKDGGSNE